MLKLDLLNRIKGAAHQIAVGRCHRVEKKQNTSVLEPVGREGGVLFQISGRLSVPWAFSNGTVGSIKFFENFTQHNYQNCLYAQTRSA